MKHQNLTFAEILEKESQMVLDGIRGYGEYYDTVFQTYLLLNDCIESANEDFEIFLRFLLEMRNNALLSIFSAVRRHRSQSKLLMRKYIELSIHAAYAIKNPKDPRFFGVNEEELC